MKLLVASFVYLIAFVAHLFPIFAFREKESYARWIDTLHSFGGMPFPGTEVLLSTLRFWWLYPAVSLAVFVYGIVLKKKALAPNLFMFFIALLWWAYFYGPVVVMGSVV